MAKSLSRNHDPIWLLCLRPKCTFLVRWHPLEELHKVHIGRRSRTDGRVEQAPHFPPGDLLITSGVKVKVNHESG